MKARLLVWLLLVSLFGCVPLLVKSRTLENREFSAGNGTFIFRDLVLDGDTLPGSWKLEGFVRNNTNEDLRQVQFDFRFYEGSGTSLDNHVDGNVRFTAYSLMNHDEQSFTTNYFHIQGREGTLQRIGRYEITYKDPSQQIEKQESEKRKGDKLKFVLIKPSESHEQFFEDQAIKIVFSIAEKQIGLLLHNKLNSPIKIDWNNVSYVDISGLAHGVVHTGVRYIERDRPQVPTLIPPAAMIEDAIIPSDHISYTAGSGGGWSSRPLFSGSKILTYTSENHLVCSCHWNSMEP